MVISSSSGGHDDYKDSRFAKVVSALRRGLVSPKWKDKEEASKEFQAWITAASNDDYSRYPLTTAESDAICSLYCDLVKTEVAGILAKSDTISSVMESRCLLCMSHWKSAISFCLDKEKATPGTVTKKTVSRLFSFILEILWKSLGYLLDVNTLFLVTLHAPLVKIIEQFFCDSKGIQEGYLTMEITLDILKYCLSAISGFTWDPEDHSTVICTPHFPMNFPVGRLFLPCSKVICLIVAQVIDPEPCKDLLYRVIVNFADFLKLNRSDNYLTTLLISAIGGIFAIVDQVSPHTDRDSFIAFIAEILVSVLNEARPNQISLLLEICKTLFILDPNSKFGHLIQCDRLFDVLASFTIEESPRSWVLVDCFDSYHCGAKRKYVSSKFEFDLFHVPLYMSKVVSLNHRDDPLNQPRKKARLNLESSTMTAKMEQGNLFAALTLSFCLDKVEIISFCEEPISKANREGKLLFYWFQVRQEVCPIQTIDSIWAQIQGFEKENLNETWFEIVGAIISHSNISLERSKEILSYSLQFAESHHVVLKLFVFHKFCLKLKKCTGIVSSQTYKELIHLLGLAFSEPILEWDYQWCRRVVIDTISTLLNTSHEVKLPSHEALLTQFRKYLNDPLSLEQQTTNQKRVDPKQLLSSFKDVNALFFCDIFNASLKDYQCEFTISQMTFDASKLKVFAHFLPICPTGDVLLDIFHNNLDQYSAQKFHNPSLSTFCDFFVLAREYDLPAPNVSERLMISSYCTGRTVMGWEISDKLMYLLTCRCGLYMEFTNNLVLIVRMGIANSQPLCQEWMQLTESILLNPAYLHSARFQEYICLGLEAIQRYSGKKFIEWDRLYSWFYQKWLKGKLRTKPRAIFVKILAENEKLESGELSENVYLDLNWSISATFVGDISHCSKINGKSNDTFETILRNVKLFFNLVSKKPHIELRHYARILKYILMNMEQNRIPIELGDSFMKHIGLNILNYDSMFGFQMEFGPLLVDVSATAFGIPFFTNSESSLEIYNFYLISKFLKGDFIKSGADLDKVRAVSEKPIFSAFLAWLKIVNSNLHDAIIPKVNVNVKLDPAHVFFEIIDNYIFFDYKMTGQVKVKEDFLLKVFGLLFGKSQICLKAPCYYKLISKLSWKVSWKGMMAFYHAELISVLIQHWEQIEASSYRFLLTTLTRIFYHKKRLGHPTDFYGEMMFKMTKYFDLKDPLDVVLGHVLNLGIKLAWESGKREILAYPLELVKVLVFLPDDLLESLIDEKMLEIIETCLKNLMKSSLFPSTRFLFKKLYRKLQVKIVDQVSCSIWLSVMSLLTTSSYKCLDYDPDAYSPLESAYVLVHGAEFNVVNAAINFVSNLANLATSRRSLKYEIRHFPFPLQLFCINELDISSCAKSNGASFKIYTADMDYEEWLKNFIAFFAARKSPYASELCLVSLEFAKSFLYSELPFFLELKDCETFKEHFSSALETALLTRNTGLLEVLITAVLQHLCRTRSNSCMSDISFFSCHSLIKGCILINAVPEAYMIIEMKLRNETEFRNLSLSCSSISPINASQLSEQVIAYKSELSETISHFSEMDKDLFYSLDSSLILDHITSRLEHEGKWSQNIAWLLSEDYTEKKHEIHENLVRLGYSSLAGKDEAKEFSVAWRLGQWDVDETLIQGNQDLKDFIPYKIMQLVSNDDNPMNQEISIVQSMLDKCAAFNSIDFRQFSDLYSESKQWRLGSTTRPKNIEFIHHLNKDPLDPRWLSTQICSIKNCLANDNISLALKYLKGVKQLGINHPDFPQFLEYEFGRQMSEILLQSDSLDSATVFLRKYCDCKDYQVSPLLLIELGCLEYKSKKKSPKEILETVFQPSVHQIEMIGINDNGMQSYSPESMSDAYFSIAQFAFEEYNSISNSEYYSQLQALYKQKMTHISAFKDTGVLQNNQKREKRQLSLLEMAMNHDKQELEHYHDNINRFKGIAFEYYLKCMEHGEKHVNSLYRLCSLWFQDSQSTALSTCLKSYIDRVPSHRFIPVLYQLIAKLSHNTSNQTDSNVFKSSLSNLIARMLHQHPYHTLYPVLAADISISSIFQRSEYGIAGDDQKKFQAILNEAITLRNAYLELGNHEIRGNNVPLNKPLKLDSKLQLCRLKALNVIPVITKGLEIDKRCRYEQIVSIVRFSSSFEVLGGINLPKVVKCIGSDGVSYSQLVKGKDELRQDAIMEQFFLIVNRLLAVGKETKSRSLQIRTYRIIPLADLCGVIEFVTGTRTIGSYVKEAHSKFHPNDFDSSTCRSMMMNEHEGKSSFRSKLAVFRKITSRTRPVLGLWFLETFQDACDWLEKRLRYTKSVAVNSMIGYAVGLGDRHLQNLLIDVQSGEVILIDLNLIFDQARRLKIPELVPFRLTRDILHGMGVSGVEGVFRKCCEGTLSLLHENKEILLTILEVFRHDPSCRWTLSAQTIENLKLKGKNFISSDDGVSLISNGFSEADRVILKVKEKLSGIVNGATLSVSGQVNHLIQQATNEENLCCIFPGWDPWF